MRHTLRINRQMQIRMRACIIHRMIGINDWLTTISRLLVSHHIALHTKEISIGKTKRRDLPTTSGEIRHILQREHHISVEA